MDRPGSLMLYLLVFALSSLLIHFGSKRKSKLLIVIAILIPALLAGFRDQVGTDFQAYVWMYQDLSAISLSDFFQNYSSQIEIGVYALANISSFLTGNYLLFFLLLSFSTLLFFYLGLKRFNVPHIGLAFFLFLVISFPSSFNIARQLLAISIIFYASSYILERRLWKYILWVGVAALFHKTAILFIPVYLIGKLIRKDTVLRGTQLLAMVFILAILCLSVPAIVDVASSFSMFEKYIKYQASDSAKGYVLLVKSAIIGIFLLFYRHLKHIRYFALFFVFSLLELVISIAALNSIDISRMALYFSVFVPVLLTYVVDIFGDRVGKHVATSLTIIYGILYFITFYYLLGSSDIFPYNYWMGV